MSNADPATRSMIAHLEEIARRVAECAGDVAAIRAVIDDYSRLDEATRRVEARCIESGSPPGEWVVADNARPDRRMLYLHGGSWMSGSPYGYRPLAARISKQSGYSVFVLDYRLAPENPFPAGLDDCLAAWRWLLDNAPEAQSAAHRLVVAGDSAGGNLALATALRTRDEGLRAPDAVVALSPAVDLTWASGSIASKASVDPILRPDRLQMVAETYVQSAARLDDPHVSPVFGDFGHVQRALIQVGDREVLLDDARRIAERLDSQGVNVDLQVYEGMPHVFQLFAPTVDAASRAVERIGEFVNEPD